MNIPVEQIDMSLVVTDSGVFSLLSYKPDVAVHVTIRCWDRRQPVPSWEALAAELQQALMTWEQEGGTPVDESYRL